LTQIKGDFPKLLQRRFQILDDLGPGRRGDSSQLPGSFERSERH